jgi:hypothetical protein
MYVDEGARGRPSVRTASTRLKEIHHAATTFPDHRCRRSVLARPADIRTPPVERMIGAVSAGTPDLSLAHPVRVDLTSADYIHMRQVCSSGMASVPVECGGSAYLIGTPVN